MSTVEFEVENDNAPAEVGVSTILGVDKYPDLKGKPKINGVELLGDKTAEELGIKVPDISHLATKQELEGKQDKGDYATRSELPKVPSKVSAFENDKGYLTEHQDISGLATKQELSTKLDNTTKYGSSVKVDVNEQTYVLKISLRDQNGDVLGGEQTVDLPLETMVVGATYDETTREIVLTLTNGESVRFSVADLVSGLATKEELEDKQDVIPDLSTIRTGASKGTTAVQPEDIKVKDVQANGTSLLADGVANIPVATRTVLGLVKQGNANETGVQVVNEELCIYQASDARIDSKTGNAPITPSNLDYAVKSGVTTNAIELSEDEKQAVCAWLGTIKDVQTNGTSVVENGIANIPMATNESVGVCKGSTSFGTYMSNAVMCVWGANENEIKAKNSNYKPIMPKTLDLAVKTGITTNTIELTDEEKSNAQSWLGVIKDVQTNGSSIVQDGIANIPYASTTSWGLIKIVSNYGIGANSNGQIYIINPSDAQITAKSGFIAVTCSTMDKALKNSITTNTTELTDEEKQAACNWLGAVNDVQANGTSIVENGVANIPMATQNTLGLVRPVQANGIYVSSTGTLNLSKLSNASLVNKNSNYAVLVSQIDLATKVGVTTNKIALTDEEKTSACDWIGAGQQRTTVVDSTTPTVVIETALGNTDYQYGTITSLTITSVEESYLETNFYFTAGSEIAVDLPDTLKIIGTPSFEANKQYAMSICNNTLIVGTIS